jgi:mycothiol synthase
METVRVAREFSSADVAAVHALADAVESRTGVGPFGDETWAGLEEHSGHADVGLFVDGPAGELRAYAHLAHHHTNEWSIELASLGDGDEAAPAAALARRAVEVVAADGGGHLTFWVHGASPADESVADAAGFTHERDLLQLRVPLPLATPARWPDGITVRTFQPGTDDDAWVAVNNRAFAGHPEQGAWTVDMLRQRAQEPWFDPDGFLLAFDADGLAGFCWTKVHDADPPREPTTLGEIYVIGADPRWHGRGLGRALTTGGLESLAERGITVGMLYVDGDNVAAVGLYRALGFTDHRVDRAYGCTVPDRSTP